jgi:hypothetical protein
MERACWTVEIAGEGVLPETTAARDLADFLIWAEEAITTQGGACGLEVDQAVVVSLVGIERGHSSRLRFSIRAGALAAVAAISTAVADGDYGRLCPATHAALHKISERSSERNWEVRFVENPALGLRPGLISPSRPVPPLGGLRTATGTTTLFGVCFRVGGVTAPRAEVRLANGVLLHLDITRDLAKVLAKRLYEKVCIQGVATWTTGDWSIQGFRATGVAEFSAPDPQTAFDELGRAAGAQWAGVDALEYVRRLRSSGVEG